MAAKRSNVNLKTLRSLLVAAKGQAPRRSLITKSPVLVAAIAEAVEMKRSGETDITLRGLFNILRAGVEDEQGRCVRLPVQYDSLRSYIQNTHNFNWPLGPLTGDSNAR